MIKIQLDSLFFFLARAGKVGLGLGTVLRSQSPLYLRVAHIFSRNTTVQSGSALANLMRYEWTLNRAF